MDEPVPQVLEEIVALVACRRQATARVDVHCACRLQAPGDSTGGRALRLSLTGARRQQGGRALVGKQIVDGPVPQIQEKIVEVIKVMLREQCQ